MDILTKSQGIFLNKILDPGYWEHIKCLVGSVSRYINRAVAQEYVATVTVEETTKSTAEWSSVAEVEIFEATSYLVHKVIVRSLMGEDFYVHSCKELLDLLHAMEKDIGSLLSFVLPEWIPHPPARRLEAAKNRFKEIFLQRLSKREADTRYNSFSTAGDYITYTLHDKTTAPLKDLLPSHHTILMFASHTSTVANIAWTIISVRHTDQFIQHEICLFLDSNFPTLL
jgi:cytochrome P450